MLFRSDRHGGGERPVIEFGNVEAARDRRRFLGRGGGGYTLKEGEARHSGTISSVGSRAKRGLSVEEAGFDPVSARNTDEAMLVLEARSTICIVFTDVEMPLGATNGLSLAFTVRDRWPHIELIITSGHTMIDEVDLPVRGRFFSKPYHAPEIIRAMHLMVAR